MQARIVDAAHGARWLAQGWQIFRAAPFGWLGMVFAYWLLMTLVSVLPVVGVVAACVLVPPFSVGFMAVARAASRGATLELGLLFEGFRDSLRSQLVLGAIYFVCLLALLGATALADGGSLMRWMVGGERPDEAVAASPPFLRALALAAVLYLPVMLAFWFAPPLAAWHGCAPAKALFFSFIACLLNWRAFLAYGAVTAAATLVVPFAAISVLTAVSGGTARAPVASAAFALLIVMLPTLFASFYASYRDVFGGEPRPV